MQKKFAKGHRILFYHRLVRIWSPRSRGKRRTLREVIRSSRTFVMLLVLLNNDSQ